MLCVFVVLRIVILTRFSAARVLLFTSCRWERMLRLSALHLCEVPPPPLGM
jgi:hypothetical protein